MTAQTGMAKNVIAARCTLDSRTVLLVCSTLALIAIDLTTLHHRHCRGSDRSCRIRGRLLILPAAARAEVCYLRLHHRPTEPDQPAGRSRYRRGVPGAMRAFPHGPHRAVPPFFEARHVCKARIFDDRYSGCSARAGRCPCAVERGL